MQIKLIAVGKNMPTWVTDGFQEYCQRLPNNYAISLIEITPEKRTKQANLNQIIEKEEAKIEAAIPSNAYTVAFDRIGKRINTRSLATQLHSWHDMNETVCLIIGGPEGLSKKLLNKMNMTWSLSELTLPHPLVRVVVAEQIYRAWSIIVNHPYHR